VDSARKFGAGASLEPPGSLEVLDDTELLRLTREGSNEAYATLYDRYAYGARRLARHLGQREESEDVVADAFAQMLDLLRRGKGPDQAFRAYLFTTIRHESGRRAKANKRVMPTDDDSQIDTVVPFGDGQLDAFEKTTVRAAYESLPDRWQTVLWQLDVEGRKPHEIADAMGLKPNTVSALVYRARSGLRDAYLQQHVNPTDQPDEAVCRDVRRLLAGVVRRTASMRDQEKVHAHLETCDACVAIHLDLQEVNREVGAVAATAATATSVGGGVILAATHVLAGAKGTLVALVLPAVAAVATVTLATASVPEPPELEATHEAARVLAPAATPAAEPAERAVTRKSTPAPSRTAASSAASSTTPAAKSVPVAVPPAAVAAVTELTAGLPATVEIEPVSVVTRSATDLLEKAVPGTTAAVKELAGG
jgi:RNA polymerase sigma factor (sigma-70 family)